MDISLPSWMRRLAIQVIVHIDRPELAREAAKIIGRELTIEELENLEVQIESYAISTADQEVFVSKDWIEAAIFNDDIPA
jgi:hypothetical protein